DPLDPKTDDRRYGNSPAAPDISTSRRAVRVDEFASKALLQGPANAPVDADSSRGPHRVPGMDPKGRSVRCRSRSARCLRRGCTLTLIASLLLSTIACDTDEASPAATDPTSAADGEVDFAVMPEPTDLTLTLDFVPGGIHAGI